MNLARDDTGSGKTGYVAGIWLKSKEPKKNATKVY